MLIRPVLCRYFLPPIIFFAGVSVRKKAFFRNFISIASFGILGTYLEFAIIIGVLLVYRSSFGFLTTTVSSCTLLLLLSYRLFAWSIFAWASAVRW